MTSSPGHPERIGSYPIERELGRGGMGIVYLGRDTRLDRAVAIKVLPQEFSSDPERLARFEREARMVAALNHTNIAGIYGIEEADGRRFLALEYVEGDTLAERIARGPLPPDETLEIARQIAAGLEAAHESGVIHRDLKPGNIKLTPAGDVKILDFGLAKSGGGAETASGSNLSHSPTMTYAGTVAGVILGTAAYMSPEQARGRTVDRRTDIWSFGCVLFECLTGCQAFAGDTVSDMVALILQGTPPWDALPDGITPGLRRLLERCLEKDAKKRLRDIGDARLDIEEMIAGKMPVAGTAAPVIASAKPARAAWIVALLFAVTTVGLAAIHWTSKPPPVPAARLSLGAPSGIDLFENSIGVGLSPDGRTIAFIGADSSGTSSIWLRPISSMAARMIPGTEDAVVLFWSPDGRQIAFTTDDKLKKVNLEGGSPETICSVKGAGRGGAWSPDGTIVLASTGDGPLVKVSANGGSPAPITELDAVAHETGHRFPIFLPDGRHFLFASLPSRDGAFTIRVGSTESAERESLMTADGVPAWVEPGWLLYGRKGRLVAHRFNAAKRRLVGEAVSLGDELSSSDWLGAPSVLARPGIAAYFRQSLARATLVWLDREGRRLSTVPAPPGDYESLSLSPDGERVVVDRRVSPTESDLWIVDLVRGGMTRFTFGPGRNESPLWSPDGSRIAFSSNRDGTWDLYIKPASGALPEERLPADRASLSYPAAWSPDGRTLLFRQLGEKTDWDLFLIDVDGDDRRQVPWMQTPFREYNACFSPDGRWVCYESNESGLHEIYVQSFPTPGRKYKITNGGGGGPVWSTDGREIGFADFAGRASFVAVQAGDEFSASLPVPSFTFPRVIAGAVSGDLQRFLVAIEDENDRAPGEIMVLLNWESELAKR